MQSTYKSSVSWVDEGYESFDIPSKSGIFRYNKIDENVPSRRNSMNQLAAKFQESEHEQQFIHNRLHKKWKRARNKDDTLTIHRKIVSPENY